MEDSLPHLRRGVWLQVGEVLKIDRVCIFILLITNNETDDDDDDEPLLLQFWALAKRCVPGTMAINSAIVPLPCKQNMCSDL